MNSLKVIEIILIVLCSLYIITFIGIIIWATYKPKKYYKVEYNYDNRYVSTAIIKAKTPEKAIRKLIHKYERDFPLNEVTDIISCTEIDYYKCLKEVDDD